MTSRLSSIDNYFTKNTESQQIFKAISTVFFENFPLNFSNHVVLLSHIKQTQSTHYGPSFPITKFKAVNSPLHFNVIIVYLGSLKYVNTTGAFLFEHTTKHVPKKIFFLEINNTTLGSLSCRYLSQRPLAIFSKVKL